jgi:hypothetical protein
MISRDPKCVFVASDAAQAAVVANWLEHQSIPARVMDTMTLGGLDGLTAWTGVSARGIEVWVLRPDDAERARALVEEHNALQSDLEAQDPARSNRARNAAPTLMSPTGNTLTRKQVLGVRNPVPSSSCGAFGSRSSCWFSVASDCTFVFC